MCTQLARPRSVFHSTATFTCPYGSSLVAAPDTSKVAPSTAAVLLEGFDKILEVDRANYVVRAQSGLKVLDLLRWAEKNGMSAPLGAPANYAELTLGGVIATDAHGTGSNVSSTMVRARSRHATAMEQSRSGSRCSSMTASSA